MQGGRKPGPDHPITIAPAGERVVVKLDDTVLADSRDALILKEASFNPVYYIPRADVAMGEFSPSDTSTHCPYKGDASYFSARGGAAKDVAWSHEDPFDHMLIIKGYLAFYPDRADAIEATPRD
ncbi:DUF427 domain-containing protein [Agrobacterium tumefaciens]|uniref:DUF427 domain-containing protein n=1 Tax=Agrobacterium tumefaciens TaxID=358 RepID=UPI0021D11D24|nr:DUF427 domain-containing protein [Agrobacterium tumefaciens]UXS10086.1 DUF427 domain-containing protein [Agrobacterium tumefaciens]UXS17445.1 DUF427 domain-containing protein [Agrobacterium tumefaciens]UXT68001.1 DUF427 domain-containing protein [Agrobacterium tumefaciens]